MITETCDICGATSHKPQSMTRLREDLQSSNVEWMCDKCRKFIEEVWLKMWSVNVRLRTICMRDYIIGFARNKGRQPSQLTGKERVKNALVIRLAEQAENQSSITLILVVGFAVLSSCFVAHLLEFLP
jgi:hypothetical protein